MADTIGDRDHDACLELREKKGDDVAGQDVPGEEAPILQECTYISSDSQNESTDSLSLNISDDAKSGEGSLSAAPVLSAVEAEVNTGNVLRSPPKLQPAVAVVKRKSDEAMKVAFKPLTGSMRNTPASLSIIDAPSSSSGRPMRSTRSSIDPKFAAKQRSFLNKVHNALSANRIDDTSSCESDSEMIEVETSDDRSPSYIPGFEDIEVRRASLLLNGSIKRKREDSTACKMKVSETSNNEELFNSDTVEEKDVDYLLYKKRMIVKDTSHPPPKKRISISDDGTEKLRDAFCWFCHRPDVDLDCASCPRAYHSRCLRRCPPVDPDAEWVCPECVTVIKAENQETRSKALKMLTLDELCKLLQFAVDRMKSCTSADVFESPVDDLEFPSYKDVIINPMSLSTLEKNIKRKMYGSTEAFTVDASWIVHNCVVFNSSSSKLSSVAKTILKVCKQEMAEIENCPDCYKYAYSEDENWFIQVCQKPHLLVWAKLKGFPFWPAKAIRANSDSLDVRFFGAHDRAWVPIRDCYLYSQENPNPAAPSKPQPKRHSKNNLDTCVEEVELHIQLLKEKFVEFKYAPVKTHVLSAKKLTDHLKFMLPHYAGEPFTVVNTASSSKRTSPKVKTVSGLAPKRMRKNTSSSSLHDPTAKENGTSVSSDIVSATNTVKRDSGVEEETGSPTPVNSNGSVSLGTGAFETKKNLESIKPDSNSHSPGRLTSPEAVNIVEQHLKKRDARKVGLVDRIQEKLALWTARPLSPSTDNLTFHKTNTADVTNEEADIKEESPGEETEPFAVSSGNKEPSKIDDICSKQSEENCIPETLPHKSVCNVQFATDQNNSKPKDLFAGAKPVQDGAKESVNKILQAFNMSKSHPKVVLRKLVFTKDEKESSEAQKSKDLVDSPLMKTEMTENGVDSTKLGYTAQLAEAEMFTISDMLLCPDDIKEQRAKLPAPPIKLTASSTRKSKPAISIKKALKPLKESVESATKPATLAQASCTDGSSTEPLVEIAPDPATKNTDATVKEKMVISSDKPGVKPKVKSVMTQPVKAQDKQSLAGPTESPQGSSSDGSSMESVVESASDLAAEPSAVCSTTSTTTPSTATAKFSTSPIVERAAESSPKSTVQLHSKPTARVLGQSANKETTESVFKAGPASEKHALCETGIVNPNQKHSAVLGKEDINHETSKSKPVKPKMNIVHRSFSIRAKPISQLRDSPINNQKSHVADCEKLDLNNSLEPDVSISIVAESASNSGDNSTNNEQQIAVKSNVHPNPTVSVENQTSNLLKEPLNIPAIPKSSEIVVTANHSISYAVPNAKELVVVQPRKSLSNLPKPSSPPKVVTSPNRALQAGTSILKAKNPLSSDGSILLSTSNRQAIKVSASQLLTLVGQTTSSKAQSSPKSPTFVTVSQAPSGMPIVRRLLPKVIPITSGSSTPSVAGVMPVLLSSKPQSLVNLASRSSAASVESSSQSSSIIINPRLSPVTLENPPKASTPQLIKLQTPVSSELQSVLKSSSRIIVGPLQPTSNDKYSQMASSREMPLLSPASVPSLLPVSTIQAQSTTATCTRTVSASQTCVTTSSSANLLCQGPVSGELRSHANKLTDVFMGCLKDCLSEMGSMGNLEAQVRCLQLDLEHLQWRHQQEMEELRHNTELLLTEIRDSMKQEAERAVTEALAKAAKEKEEAIAATKEKQWCAFCKKEALFYCCWNTSYCDYSCQQNHWPEHSMLCSQSASSEDNGTRFATGDQQPANMRKENISLMEAHSPPLLKKWDKSPKSRKKITAHNRL